MVYEEVEPLVNPATDMKANDKLQIIDTINPGVKISIKDYWLDAEKNYEGTGTQLGQDLSDLGVNKNHTLKFSPGGGGISGAANYNKYTDGNSYAPGMVETSLGADGYPVLKVGNKESLSYLFDSTSDPAGYASIADADLLKMFASDGRGGYSFDSASNYIYFNMATGNFEVYNLSNKAGSYGGQIFPFNTVDDFFKNGAAADFSATQDIPLKTTGNRVNHYFGISMETDYVQPIGGMITDAEGNTTPMVFNFSGDDDFWLYIDGTLALDLGGIHDAMTGSINFDTGDIIATVGKTTEKTNMADIFGPDWKEAGKEHKMNIFYMERGNNLSNLKVSFNLQIPQYYYATQSKVAVKTTPGEEKYVYAGNQRTYATNETTNCSFATRSDYGVRQSTAAVLYIHHLTPDGNKEIVETVYLDDVNTPVDLTTPEIRDESTTNPGYVHVQSTETNDAVKVGDIADVTDRIAELESYGFQLDKYQIGHGRLIDLDSNTIPVEIVQPITDVYFYYDVEPEPEKPIDPEKPVEPEKPVDPETPVDPEQPVDPEAPTPEAEVTPTSPVPVATTPAKSSVKEAPVTAASVLPQTDDSSSQTGLWGAILLAMTNLLVLFKLRRTVKAKAKKK